MYFQGRRSIRVTRSSLSLKAKKETWRLLVNCFLRPGFLEAEGPGKVGVQLLVNCFLRPGFLEAEGPGKVGVQGIALSCQIGSLG